MREVSELKTKGQLYNLFLILGGNYVVALKLEFCQIIYSLEMPLGSLP